MQAASDNSTASAVEEREEASVATSPVIWTDKDDYAPGETVTIFGSGFHPDSTIWLVIYNPQDETVAWDSTSDIAGSFVTTFTLGGYQPYYTVIAQDAYGNNAQTTFTDSPKVGSLSVGTQSPNPVNAGNSASYIITIGRGTGAGSAGAFDVNLSITTTVPSGISVLFSPNPVSFTPTQDTRTATLTISTTGATPGGTTSFTVLGARNDNSVDNASGSGTLSVVAANAAPVAVAQSVTTDEDTPKLITLRGTDANGDSLTFSIVTQPSSGTLGSITPINATASSVTYTPNSDFDGADSFTFRVNDGTVNSTSPATVSITVNPVNDPPVAVDDSYNTNEDTPLVVNGVLDNDTDIENDVLSAILVDNVDNGVLVLNANGSFTYAPDANFNGVDSFTYNANDGDLLSNTA
ncbi:MAG: Ig-like domain-containing protein, partial [Nitrososphaera sp.]